MTCSELMIRPTISSKPSKNRQIVRKTPADIVETFNTWAFKRHQPDGADVLLQKVAIKSAEQQPLQFLLYWGKGPRHGMGEAEIRCLDFIASMTRRIGQTYAPGGKFTLILTDTHARLNGHAQGNIDAYFGEVASAATDYDFSTCRLSDVLDQADLDVGASHGEDPRLDPIFADLVKSATKWYFGGLSAEDGAAAYYTCNMQEKRAVETVFPDSIFVTFNGPEFRVLFPRSLPIFYMYSLKRGCSVKPWFLTE